MTERAEQLRSSIRKADPADFIRRRAAPGPHGAVGTEVPAAFLLPGRFWEADLSAKRKMLNVFFRG